MCGRSPRGAGLPDLTRCSGSGGRRAARHNAPPVLLCMQASLSAHSHPSCSTSNAHIVKIKAAHWTTGSRGHRAPLLRSAPPSLPASQWSHPLPDALNPDLKSRAPRAPRVHQPVKFRTECILHESNHGRSCSDRCGPPLISAHRQLLPPHDSVSSGSARGGVASWVM